MNLPKTPRRTTPAFGFSYLERALKDCLRKREFGLADKQNVVDFFGQWEPQPSCVFCGTNKGVSRWDHLVAVMDNGSTVAGNMVLSCASCDDSKGRRPYEEWMRGTAAMSPTTQHVSDVEDRIRWIKRYIAEFGYVRVEEEQGLIESEVRRRAAVRSELAKLEKEVKSLVEDYRKRTGNR